MTVDPLAPLMELPGVAAASDRVRDALSRVHRHRANLRGWPVAAAEASDGAPVPMLPGSWGPDLVGVAGDGGLVSV